MKCSQTARRFVMCFMFALATVVSFTALGDDEPLAPDATDDPPAVAMPASVDDVLRVLEEREAMTISGNFVWNVMYTRHPHTASDPEGNSFPEVEINRLEEGLTFRFDDAGRFLYRYYGQPSTPDSLAINLSSHSFDGEELITHFPRDDVAGGQVNLYESDEFEEFNNTSLSPFLFAFRPAAGGRLSAEMDLELIVEEQMEGETATVKVVAWEANRHRVYELDPEHDYRLVSFAWYVQSTHGEVGSGRLLTELTMDAYYDDSELGSQVPRAWHTVHRTHDGRKSHEMSSELVSYELNELYDRDDFTLRPFPEGAIIVDEALDRVGVQQKDGSVKWFE